MATPNAPRVAPGYMGDNGLFSNIMADALETVPALTWPESVTTYGKMRHDPQISAVLNAYILPLLSGTWAVNPAGCRDEVVELVADGFGLQILGNNDDPGPARRRGVDWYDHLRLALLSLVFGHMPFAQRYDFVNGRMRLAELAERMPQTISRIEVADDGDLAGILQYGETNLIPRTSMAYYAHQREGSAWAGRSMLRPAYGPWLLKHEMWRVLATSSRRFGMGVPEVTAPPGGTPAQTSEAHQLAASIRVGDQGGVGLPYGFQYVLRGMTGSVPDTLAFVRYLDQQVAQSVLATVLNLDASPNGSRALGETLVGLLQLSWEAVGREITTEATRVAIQMVDYNWGEDEPAPRVTVVDINKQEATIQSITELINAGAIQPDQTLEAALRDRLRLPRQVEEIALASQGIRDVTALVGMVRDLYLGVGTVITAPEARELLNRAGADLPVVPEEDLLGRPSTYQAVPTPQPIAADVPEDAKVVAADPGDTAPADTQPANALPQGG